MNNLPFLLKINSIPARAPNYPRDRNVSDDPLPAILAITATGLVYNRGTTVTDIKVETFDDK